MAKARYAELVRLCTSYHITLSTAESCTGGSLGSSITDIPGASGCYLGGAITYSNESKIDILGVDEEAISRHGAVSREVALQMAEGCRKRFRSDIAASLTGIAGPTGGSPQKPVGTVYIAVMGGDKPAVCEGFMLGDIGRRRFKSGAGERALGMMLGRVRTMIEGGERDGDGLSA